MHPLCDQNLSVAARAHAAVAPLSNEQALALLGPDPHALASNYCLAYNKGFAVAEEPGLVFPPFMWLVEINTGVASACLAAGRCATVFPSPLGLGAALNRSLYAAKGRVVATEQRAFSNAGGFRNVAGVPYGEALIGTVGFGPNVNLLRDPRWGRASEVPGESPFVSGVYATEYSAALQERDALGHPKVAAFLKHFTAYSRETDRGEDNYNISARDFAASFFPAFRAALEAGVSSGVMCSYDGENGHASCANGPLLAHVRRWHADALVMSDCAAISNLMYPPVSASTNVSAAAYALGNGTDIEAGSDWYVRLLPTALADGLLDAAAVRQSAARRMRLLLTTGLFDDPATVAWTSIPPSVIGSEEHAAVALSATLQSLVLLRNEAGALPLDASAPLRLAVLGPHSDSQHGLLSSYYGDEVCYNPAQASGPLDFSCILTLSTALRNLDTRWTVANATGVDINSTRTSGISTALELAKGADRVLLAIGLNRSIEREGHDRTSLSLPGLQLAFAKAVARLGVPITVLVVTGGPVDLSPLLALPSVDSIVQSFYPGTVGMRAVVDTLAGRANKFGKLPYNIYYANFTENPMVRYNLAEAPGRTFRYFRDPVVFPFGFGLSYTTFSSTLARVPNANESRVDVTVMVTNTGLVRGDEAIVLYHVPSAEVLALAPFAPLREVRQFDRVTLEPGASKAVNFSFDRSRLCAIINEQGEPQLYPGNHMLSLHQSGKPGIVVQIGSW